MPAPYLISSFLASVLISLSILFEVYIWQRKEYRFDRIRSYLLSPEGSVTKNWSYLLLSVCILFGWLGYLMGMSAVSDGFGWAALLAVAAGYGVTFAMRGVYRPVVTQKSLLLAIMLTIVVILLTLFTLTNLRYPALQLATVLFFIPPVSVIGVLLANLVGVLMKKKTIARAKELRANRNQMKVIGITGSMGKTSTKEFTKHILESAGRNINATKNHRNSEYTVAVDMLEQLTKEPEFYVAEMAAYKKGEIKALVDIAKPHIGVVTAISNQHAALFGSVAALAQAKWELIRGLPTNGVAVLNYDDDRVRELAKTYSGKKVLYSLHEKVDVYAEHISLGPTSISLTLHIGDSQEHVTLPGIGDGVVYSALAAAAAAFAAGVQSKVIYSALRTLPQIPRTMEIRKGLRGSFVIDDSYSGGEAAALSAISYLAYYKSEDVRIIFVPIIELGSEGEKVHERIGKALADSRASVFIYGNAYKNALQRGMGSRVSNALWFTNAKKLSDAVVTGVRSDTVILLEGRLPGMVRSALIR